MTRHVSIYLRATHRQKALVDQAAEALGMSRSEFILDATCHQAKAVLPDRRVFRFDKETFRAFMERLHAAPSADPNLFRLLSTPAPWDR
ncbi:MAG TPA: DUF1778 domain-containing protein [Longimicrobiales bacterium]|nr:DUF1778 domain-containing protein [Longimicrobiales bacterium]